MSHPPPLARRGFPSFPLHRALSLEIRGLIKVSYLGPSVPESMTLQSVHLWVSLLIPIYCKKKLSDEGGVMLHGHDNVIRSHLIAVSLAE